MKNNNELSDNLLKIFYEDTRELLGEDKARKYKEEMNRRYKQRGLEPIEWDK